MVGYSESMLLMAVYLVQGAFAFANSALFGKWVLECPFGLKPRDPMLKVLRFHRK
jgi:hypothetical protein